MILHAQRLATALACIVITAIPCRAPAAGANVDAQTRHRVIAQLADELRTRYIFPDKAETAASALLGDERAGRFAKMADGESLARALTSALHERLHDLHLFVEYSAETRPAGAAKAPTMADYETFRSAVARQGYGIDAVQHLNGGICYLRLSGFPDAAIMSDALADAMKLCAGTDGLIIDERYNHGGDPAAVNLLTSYFFVPFKPVHLNDIVQRVPGTTQMDVRQFWNVAVAGPLYLDKPVYVLTGPHTFSGGEGFAYAMQVMHRATIVGGVTGGGANPTREIALDEHFSAAIPFGRALNPVTHDNWEGTGVKPDIVSAPGDALKFAYVALLKQKAAHTGDVEQRQSVEHAIDAAQSDPASILVPAIGQ